MSLHQQVEQSIRQVVEPLIRQGTDIISPIYVAEEVDKILDPRRLSPEIKTYASEMYLRDEVRRFLAHNLDPVKKIKNQLQESSTGLFSDELQEYYPVIRDVGGIKPEPVYIRS